MRSGVSKRASGCVEADAEAGCRVCGTPSTLSLTGFGLGTSPSADQDVQSARNHRDAFRRNRTSPALGVAGRFRIHNGNSGLPHVCDAWLNGRLGCGPAMAARRRHKTEGTHRHETIDREQRPMQSIRALPDRDDFVRNEAARKEQRTRSARANPFPVTFFKRAAPFCCQTHVGEFSLRLADFSGLREDTDTWSADFSSLRETLLRGLAPMLRPTWPSDDPSTNPCCQSLTQKGWFRSVTDAIIGSNVKVPNCRWRWHPSTTD